VFTAQKISKFTRFSNVMKVLKDEWKKKVDWKDWKEF